MKKILGLILGVVFVWLFGVELILNNTTALTEKAKTVSAQTTIDTISKLVILDSIPKTGMADRYKYSLNEMKDLLQKNKFSIKDDSYRYFYCSENKSSKNKQANMIATALHKENENVLAKGTNMFLKKVPQIKELSSENRNAFMLVSVLNIEEKTGECFEIKE